MTNESLISFMAGCLVFVLVLVIILVVAFSLENNRERKRYERYIEAEKERRQLAQEKMFQLRALAHKTMEIMIIQEGDDYDGTNWVRLYNACTNEGDWVQVMGKYPRITISDSIPRKDLEMPE